MRQPQRVHKPFHRLNHHDRFFIGIKEFRKVGFCRYQQINKAAHTPEEWGKQTRVRFIAPWTVVRSAEFVNNKITTEQLALLNAAAAHRNEKNKRILAKYSEGQKPYTEAELMACGKTHYVGDDCPGGHKDLPECCRDNVAVGYQAGTLPAQPDNTCVGTHNTGFGKESFAEITPTSPNNDNKVTGPTS